MNVIEKDGFLWHPLKRTARSYIEFYTLLRHMTVGLVPFCRSRRRDLRVCRPSGLHRYFEIVSPDHSTGRVDDHGLAHIRAIRVKRLLHQQWTEMIFTDKTCFTRIVLKIER